MKKKSSGALYAGDGGSDQRALCCFRGVRAAIVVIVSAHAHNTKEESEAFTQQQDGADYKSKRLQDKERLFYSQTTFFSTSRAE